MKKYSAGFERDFAFYLRMRSQFTFSGDHLRDKDGKILQIPFDRAGVSGKEAFFRYESTGRLLPTRHPLLLFALMKSKASANWHIKQYKEDREKGFLSGLELSEILKEINPPEWFKVAIGAKPLPEHIPFKLEDSVIMNDAEFDALLENSENRDTIVMNVVDYEYNSERKHAVSKYLIKTP